MIWRKTTVGQLVHTHETYKLKDRKYFYCQCRIKLLGGPVPNADGAPVLCHSLVPIPAVSLTASRFKWGFCTYRHNDDKCTHTDYITWLYLFK